MVSHGMEAALVLAVSCSILASGQPEAQAQETPGEAEFAISFSAAPGIGGAQGGGTSRGVAWGDFTGDGFPDLIVSNTDDEKLFLYRNIDGKRLEQVRSGDVASVSGHAQGVNWIDFNNDGHLDLFVAREKESNLLFANDGTGELRLKSVGSLTDNTDASVQGCWADFDNDGFLDVFVVNAEYEPDTLYRNVKGERFEPVEGPWNSLQNHARSCVWSDVNSDGFPDLYVANAYMLVGDETMTAPNYFYQNQAGKAFERIVEGEFVNFHSYSYGASFMDFDQDGDDDLFVSAIGRYDPNALFQNVDGRLFHPVRGSMLMRDRLGPAKGHVWGDYDNDGDVDLFLAEGHGGARPEHAPFDNSDRMYTGSGGGQFEVAELPALTDHNLVSAGAAAADFDRDGDLDIFIANWGNANEDGTVKQDNQFFINTSEPGNWIEIRLSGVQSNRLGIGARIKITASDSQDTSTQYRTLYSNSGYGSMSEPVFHLGLGKRKSVDEIRIFWPSGVEDVHLNLQPGARYLAVEGDSLSIDY